VVLHGGIGFGKGVVYDTKTGDIPEEEITHLKSLHGQSRGKRRTIQSDHRAKIISMRTQSRRVRSQVAGLEMELPMIDHEMKLIGSEK
jgi:hypothetical protein